MKPGAKFQDGLGGRVVAAALAAIALFAISPRASAQFVDPLQNIGQRPELAVLRC